LRFLAAFVLALALSAPAFAANWPLFDRDAARSGSVADGKLSPANAGKLHPIWHVLLPSVADAAPIVVGGRLFITATDGTTFAVDTASGKLIWKFVTHGPKITTSVPAYDPATKALYVAGVDGYLHELDPATGHERRENGFPEQITLAPATEKDASSLNLANGFLYAQTSGYIGDALPYVGHVVAIRLSDGTRHVFNTLCADRHELIEPQTCSEQRSGMWSRAGVVVDPDPSMGGRIYAATGNGAFKPGKGDYGDSIIALSADASKLLGYATPKNYDQLDIEDQDLGSSSPALLPRQNNSSTPLMMVQGGKDRVLRLLDRAHLGGVGHPLQNVELPDRLFGAPAVWTDAHGTAWIFIDLSDGVHAYGLVTANGKSRLQPAWHARVPSTREGSSVVVAGGVVFVAGASLLAALDATDGRELWLHEIGPIHWQSPSVAGAAVYCADDEGYLWKFGL
jgi:outer membrane protein assembly factor BamB